jgi:hypothetical protein
MNEMMTALEAMVTRIVQEELAAKQLTVPSYTVDAFRTAFKDYTDNHKHEFAALVSVGVLDQPWFDDAIKTEVAEASIAPSADINSSIFRDRVIEIMQANTTPPGFTFATKTAFDREVSSAVRNNDELCDWFDDHVSDRVNNMSFSVSVD